MAEPTFSEAPNDAPSKQQVEFGRWLFAQQCDFILGAAALEQVPESSLPEIAFAGRSNVGKSSLINALTGRKTLARTSNQPGRTQQLNFFVLGERLVITDLPGYGYAKAPKGTVDQWTRLVEAYLRGRPQLRRVCLLIDARHGIKPSDRDAMALMDISAVPFQLILTKCDKIKPGLLAKRLAEMSEEAAGHAAAHPEIMQSSSVSSAGISELRAALASLAEPSELS